MGILDQIDNKQKKSYRETSILDQVDELLKNKDAIKSWSPQGVGNFRETEARSGLDTAPKPVQRGLVKEILYDVGVKPGAYLRAAAANDQKRRAQGKDLWSVEGIKEGINAGIKGFKNPELAPSGERLLEGWGWNKSGPEMPIVGTPRQLVGNIFEIASEPLSAVTGGIGGKLATKALPTLAKTAPLLSKIGTNVAKGAVEGGFAGGIDAYAKDKSILEGVAAGSLGGGLFRGAGTVVGEGMSKVKGVKEPTLTPLDALTEVNKVYREAKTGPVKPLLPNVGPKKSITPPAINEMAAAADNVPSVLNERIGPITETINTVKTSFEIPKTETNPLNRPTTKQALLTGEIPDTTKVITTKIKPSTSIKLGDAANKAYIKSVDNLHRIKQLDEYVEKTTGKKLAPNEKAYVLGLNSRGSDAVASHILEERLVDAKGNVLGEGFNSITKKIPKGKLLEFEDYLINKHAPYWMADGKQVFPKSMGVTQEISNAKVAQYESKYPQFKQIAQEYYDFNNKLLKSWLVDTGIVSEESFNLWRQKYPNYVPLNRSMEDIGQPLFKGQKRGFANQSNPVKASTGSERPIISPIESSIEHIERYVKTAKRNEVMQVLINNLKRDPQALEGWAEIVPGKDDLLGDINQTLANEGIEGVVSRFNQQFDEVFHRAQNLKDGNVVTGLVNGQKVHVKINDPELLDALTNLTPQAQNVVIGALGQVTRVMKNLTTGINPVFSLARNMFRDIPTAYINSKTTNNPVVFAKDLVGSFVSVLKNDDLYKSFKSVGGGHSSSISSNRNMLAESKAKILPGYIDFKNAPVRSSGRVLKTSMGYLERFNNAIESAPRLGEFKRAQNGNYSGKVRGLYEANDVTVNFNKYGNTTKQLDAVVPYLNAAVQGIDKLKRVYLPGNRLDNTAIAKSFLAVTVPTIILYSINHRDQNYKSLSEYIKDTNFLIPKGDGTFIKIPKPREVGVMFGSSVERVLRSWQDKDPKAFDKFIETIKANFLPPGRTIVHPVIRDIPANKDFADRPIVSGDLQRLPPRLQYDSKTSEISKSIGNILNISPKQLDYLGRSYLGVVAQLGIPATSKGASVGNVLKQQVTADPLYSNDVVGDFYDKKKILDTANVEFKQTGIKPAEYNRPEQRMYGRTADRISKLRKRIQMIEKDKSLSQEQKEKQARELQAQIISLALKADK